MNKETARLELAVNHALQGGLMSRQAIASYLSLDDKRKSSAWAEYGWPSSISYDMLVGLYARSGLAHGAVKKLIGTCWKTNPWIIEGPESYESRPETDWERTNRSVLTKHLWRVFAEADKRRMVGRYSGILLHIADGKPWSAPVSKPVRLSKVSAAWAGSLNAQEYDTDVNSPTYGAVKMWRYVEISLDARSRRVIDVHPDRVFILGSSNEPGWLEPAYNSFVSVEKVEGGSGESFLKNAARHLNINFGPDIDFSSLAAMYGISVDDLQERFNEVAREINTGNDVVLPTQGATVTPLVTSVPDPRPTYDINVNTIAAALDIPTRILIGNQQGERASTEDREYFMHRCQARREDLSFEIADFIEHLIRIRVIPPKDEFSVMWDDLAVPSLKDKLANALTMSQINTANMGSGRPIFSEDEIRSAAGYDVIAEDDLGEDLPTDLDEE